MVRIFTELTPEVDYTVQYYAEGKEKKEIASLKFRALSTVNNQIMLAFEVLGVRNRSELTLLYAKRIAYKKVRVFIAKNKQAIKTATACVILSVMSINFTYSICNHEMYSNERRFENTRILRARNIRYREFN